MWTWKRSRSGVTSIQRQLTEMNCLASSILQLASGKMVFGACLLHRTSVIFNGTSTLCIQFHLNCCGSLLVLGLLSSLMREQANISHPGPKWIVLDGDIDRSDVDWIPQHCNGWQQGPSLLLTHSLWYNTEPLKWFRKKKMLFLFVDTGLVKINVTVI